MASGDVQAYFQRQKFCVVGASQDQTKFGNKVLRCYMKHNYNVVPINKKSKEIEGLSCVPSLAEWVTTAAVEHPSDLGVSIVTPPGVTKGIVEEGYQLGIDRSINYHHPMSVGLTHETNTLSHPSFLHGNGRLLGIRHFFLQPGTYDKETDAWLRRYNMMSNRC